MPTVTGMTKDVNCYRGVDSEFSQPASAGITVFSILLLAAILSFRVLSGLGAHNWARDFFAGPILRDVRNSAVILLVIGLLSGCWGAIQCRGDLPGAYGRIDYGRPALFAGMTLMVLMAILSMRAGALDIGAQSTAVSTTVYVEALDFAGGLLVPIGSVVALVLVPDFSIKRLCRASPVLALGCLLCIAALRLSFQIPKNCMAPRWHNEPFATPTTTVRADILLVTCYEAIKIRQSRRR